MRNINVISKEHLEALRALKREIESLEATEPRPRLVQISYKDYRTGKGIPKTDVGIDDGSDEAQELQRKIESKRRALVRAVSALEDWLDAVEDPEDRAILRWYYVEGLTQEEIGLRMGYSRSAIQYKVQEFWNRRTR